MHDSGEFITAQNTKSVAQSVSLKSIDAFSFLNCEKRCSIARVMKYFVTHASIYDFEFGARHWGEQWRFHDVTNNNP